MKLAPGPWPSGREWTWLALLAAVAVITLSGFWLSGGGPWIGNALDPRWREVQDWARRETPRDAVFVVPPRLSNRQSGFRVFSERSCFGDWKDGTQTFFHREFGTRWIERMKALGYDGTGRWSANYRRLGAEDLQRAVSDITGPTAVFAVLEKAHGAVDLPIEFENKGFRVLRLR